MAEFLKHDAVRFADGIFQHTVNSEAYNFPQQAWVDTLFMAGYFLVRIGYLLEREDYLEDGIRQYHGHERFLQSPATGTRLSFGVLGLSFEPPGGIDHDHTQDAITSRYNMQKFGPHYHTRMRAKFFRDLPPDSIVTGWGKERP